MKINMCLDVICVLFLHVFACIYLYKMQNIYLEFTNAFSANPANILSPQLNMHLSKCWAHGCIIKHIKGPNLTKQPFWVQIFTLS